MIKKISIIGAGNVAFHLSKSLIERGFIISQIFSQKMENAQALAQQWDAEAINDLSKLKDDVGCFIVCIKDDAIETVLEKITLKNNLIAHTSGSISMSVFAKNGFTHYGIFYPLQTFSKEKNVTIHEVPFCIEGNNENTQHTLFELAQQLSDKVYAVNSEQRKTLHLAAVFACNFTNYMYTIAHDITTKNNIDFEILKPLILETAKKIMDNAPAAMQTGPAKRNDKAVMQQQFEMLSDNKAYQEIYELLSEGIIKNDK